MRCNKPLLFALLPCTCLLASAAAQAQNADITFEGQANTIYNAPIVRQDYLIGNPAGQEQHFHEIDSTNFGLISNGTGVLLNDRDTQIFVMPDMSAGFTQFSLTSVDVATAAGNNPADSLTITGFLNGMQTGTLNVTFGNTFVTLDGSSLGTVDQLIFDGFGRGGGFEVDNLILAGGGTSNVPEPGSLALLAGSGITGSLFAFHRLRRRQR